MVTRIDLLVHTTAPSSRNDDERYKAQAEAYKSFVVAGTSTRVINHGSTNATRGFPLSSPGDMIAANTTTVMRETPQQRDDEPSNLIWDPTTFLAETQLGYTALESQIFASSSRIPKKTLKRALPIERQIVEEPAIEEQVTGDKTTVIEGTAHRAAIRDESSSSDRIPSQSSYLVSPILDRSNKKPRINEANRQYFQSSRLLFPPSEPAQENGDPVVATADPAPTLGQTAQDSQQHSSSGDDITSELPTSYSLSPESYRNRQQSIQRSISDPGPWVIEPTEPELEKQGEPEVPQQSPLRHETPKETEPSPPARSGHPAQPRFSDSETAVKDFATVPEASEGIKDTPVATPDPPTDPDLPTTIRAPAPLPSLQPFETHITESLKYLSETASLAQTYKPVSVSRDLEQSERGCWTFDITPWPAQLRSEFFQFLAKMIESGRVGWGVWCVREPASSLRVRLFCWGEIVRHIYLMLYVASKSKVRKLGLRWEDAGGEVVVQMRGADGR